eukprot:3023336-Alexandrium_andersonii.AAC.1
MAADFHRRFTLRFASFPYALLLLIKSKAETPCDARKNVAVQLVNKPPDALGITALKFKDSNSSPCCLAHWHCATHRQRHRQRHRQTRTHTDT